jgi:hypothetical protein
MFLQGSPEVPKPEPSPVRRLWGAATGGTTARLLSPRKRGARAHAGDAARAAAMSALTQQARPKPGRTFADTLLAPHPLRRQVYS